MSAKTTLKNWVGRLLSERHYRAVQSMHHRMAFHCNYVHFAVVGHPRTGSNLLVAALSTSEHVKIFKEIFAVRNRGNRAFHENYATLFSPQPRAITHVGFKLFYSHFSSGEWNDFLRGDRFDIIHLTRCNCLRTLVSLDLAIKTGRWINNGVSFDLEKRVIIDPDTIVQRLRGIKEEEELTRKRFGRWKMEEVVYEDLSESLEGELNRLGCFLGVPGGFDLSKIKLRKQNPEPLEDLIENYDAVSAALDQTEFSHYLDG